MAASVLCHHCGKPSTNAPTMLCNECVENYAIEMGYDDPIEMIDDPGRDYSEEHYGGS